MTQLDYLVMLKRAHAAAGAPSEQVVHRALRAVLADSRSLKVDSVRAWLSGEIVPRDALRLEGLFEVLSQRARQRKRSLPFTLEGWRKAAAEERRRRTGKAGHPAGTDRPATGTASAWRQAVAGSLAWDMVVPGEVPYRDSLSRDAESYAALLAGTCDAEQQALRDDPWDDSELPGRIAGMCNTLLADLDEAGVPLRLGAGDAVLLALLPFVYRTGRTLTAARLVHVRPADLEPATGATGDRKSYEVLLRGHERLVRRAGLGNLGDRSADGRVHIGWWLFHQLVNAQPLHLEALPQVPAAFESGIGDVIEPSRLTGILNHVLGRSKDMNQPETERCGVRALMVKRQLVGLLFSIAHGMAVEAVHLSPVVPGHLGIPDALEPDHLLRTIRSATWYRTNSAYGLRALCTHPAEAAALGEHAAVVGSRLRRARHLQPAELGSLRAYSQKELQVKGSDGRLATQLIRFRLDEERVQELLMGENLYRDRALAVRELYQNALDACRYRQAREQARDSGFTGAIDLVQGYDDEEGRHYLDCRDNGIGMNDTMLSDVFSRGGARFPDSPGYLDESARWEAKGVTVHPNSRFGIGVLSYFMLADEIRVTTRHLEEPGPGRTVLIAGPGHLFRVEDAPRDTPIGTTVRLYLRDGDAAPSCVTELQKLLGMAEFATSARHDLRSLVWEPGVINKRPALGTRGDAFAADGRTVPWPAEQQWTDGQVVWCEHGGGLLVDGILTSPRHRRGVLADPAGRGGLAGAVVNLAGNSRPRQLSVDRTEILDDDVSEVVEGLLRKALPALLDAGDALFDVDWLGRLSGLNPALADIVTEAAMRKGMELSLHGSPVPMDGTGYFPPDVNLVQPGTAGPSHSVDPLGHTAAGQVSGDPDDRTLLWRLLAHPVNPQRKALTALVPELDRVAAVLPARPTDIVLRTHYFHGWRQWHWLGDDNDHQRQRMFVPGHALYAARMCGSTYAAVVDRMEALAMKRPEKPRGDAVPDTINLALLSEDLRGSDGGIPGATWSPKWMATTDPVPPGRVLLAALALGISPRDVVERMEAFGFVLPSVENASATVADEETLRLLHCSLTPEDPDDIMYGSAHRWLQVSEVVPPGHVLRASAVLGLEPSEVVRRLRMFGLTTPDPRGEPDQDTVRLLSLSLDGEEPWLDIDTAVPLGQIMRVAQAWEQDPAVGVARLRDLGFTMGFDPARLAAWVEQGREWGWDAADWDAISEENVVAPGTVVRTALARGLPLREVARRCEDLGLTPPESLPEQPEEDDAILLNWRLRDGLQWFQAGTEVDLNSLVAAVAKIGSSPARVAARLNAYGLKTWDGPLPSETGSGDADLLDAIGRYRHIEPGWSLSLENLLGLAARRGRSPREIVDRLAAYGLTAESTIVPDAVGRQDAELMSSPQEYVTARTRLRRDRPVSAFHVLRRSAELHFTVPEVLARLEGYGFRLPELQDLDEADRRLCEDRFGERYGAEPLPLELEHPIVDYLAVVRLAGLPFEELLPRLERIGVDLDRVAGAIRAALPAVPGLIVGGRRPRVGRAGRRRGYAVTPPASGPAAWAGPDAGPRESELLAAHAGEGEHAVQQQPQRDDHQQPRAGRGLGERLERVVHALGPVRAEADGGQEDEDADPGVDHAARAVAGHAQDRDDPFLAAGHRSGVQRVEELRRTVKGPCAFWHEQERL